MRTFKILGFCFLALGGLAIIVMLLLPFGILQKAHIFTGTPERTLWLLSALGFAFGGSLVAIAKLEHLSNDSVKKLETRAAAKLPKAEMPPAELSAKAEERFSISKSATAGACALLILGLLPAVELFLMRAFMQNPPKATSLWWVFVICSLLGTIGAIVAWATNKEVLTEREEKVKKMERKAEVRARGMQHRSSLKIYRFNVRPHAACHQKPLLQRRRDRTAYASRDITTYSWH